MRTFKIFALLVIVLMFMCCSKSDNQPVENIVFQNINKTITDLIQDSIQGNCKDLIFEIQEYDLNQFTALIKLNSLVIPCDGFNHILTDLTTGKVKLLEENQKILESDNWGSVNGISLDEFAGKGEKYIGYRSGYYPLSSNRYNYGWIKIDLSENRQTLRIISRATNYTDNVAIRTGQK